MLWIYAAMESPPEYDENTMAINLNNRPEEAKSAEPCNTNCDTNDDHPKDDDHNDDSDLNDYELERPTNSKEGKSHPGTLSSIESKHKSEGRGCDIDQ